jgi:hypothetical protein
MSEDGMGGGSTFLINNADCTFSRVIEEIRKIRVE